MPSNAQQDDNQVYSLLLARGTSGTASGTAATVAAGGDPTTGAMYVYNLGPAGSVAIGGTNPAAYQPVRLTDGTSFYNATGAGGGTSVQVEHGTIEAVTTVSNITNGTIRVTAGTVAVTTPGTITSGSISLIAGTIGAGTLNTLGTVSNILAGTIQNSGTVTGVGVVSAITSGTVSVNTPGTITSGSVAITAGSVVGTVLTNQNSGTLNVGTINVGTFTNQPYPASQVQSSFAAGTALIGTLIAAAGAGTGIYINSLSLTCMSGTLDMCLSFGLGSTTNQVVNRGLYVPGGGIAMTFPHPSFYGTSNSALTYQILSGAGTASWQVTYTTKGTP